MPSTGLKAYARCIVRSDILLLQSQYRQYILDHSRLDFNSDTVLYVPFPSSSSIACFHPNPRVLSISRTQVGLIRYHLALLSAWPSS